MMRKMDRDTSHIQNRILSDEEADAAPDKTTKQIYKPLHWVFIVDVSCIDKKSLHSFQLSVKNLYYFLEELFNI